MPKGQPFKLPKYFYVDTTKSTHRTWEICMNSIPWIAPEWKRTKYQFIGRLGPSTESNMGFHASSREEVFRNDERHPVKLTMEQWARWLERANARGVTNPYVSNFVMPFFTSPAAQAAQKANIKKAQAAALAKRKAAAAAPATTTVKPESSLPRPRLRSNQELDPTIKHEYVRDDGAVFTPGFIGTRTRCFDGDSVYLKTQLNTIEEHKRLLAASIAETARLTETLEYYKGFGFLN